MVTVKESINYPMISASTWWTLRKKLSQSPSLRITDTTLATLLQMKPISAKNLISPLRRIGLIDSEGKPTERALRWRNDDQYPQVCEDIRKEIYPEDLVNLFSGSDVSRSSLENWFANTAAVGNSAKKAMAAFYLLLTEADPTKQDSTSSSAKGSKPGKPASPSSKMRSPKTKKTDLNGSNGQVYLSPDAEAKIPSSPQHMSSITPSLHIDIQIHIPPDASADQIDHIFASMAKHLYKGNTENEK
jgi:hypothetical protein